MFATRMQHLYNKATSKSNDTEIPFWSLYNRLPENIQMEIGRDISSLNHTINTLVTRLQTIDLVAHIPTNKTIQNQTSTYNKYCRYHKWCSHITEECYVINKNKNQDKNKSNTQTNLSNITCLKCNNKGHYTNKYISNNNNNNNITSTSKVNLLQNHYTSHDLPLAPAIIKDNKTFTLIDSGSNLIAISRNIVKKLSLETETLSTSLTIAGELNLNADRLIKPIRIVCGNLNENIQPYVIDMNKEHNLLIGLPYFNQIGIELKGVPFSYTLINDINSFESNDDLNEIKGDIKELKKPLTDFQINLRNILDPIIIENSSILDNAFCPHPAAIINLLVSSNETFFKRQYTIANTIMPIIDEQINNWINTGTILPTPINTPYNTPLFAIPKKDSTGAKTLARICHDFRPLNNILLPDSFPLPTIHEIFTNLSNSVIFTTLDLQSAFHRFLIAEEDQLKTPLLGVITIICLQELLLVLKPFQVNSRE